MKTRFVILIMTGLILGPLSSPRGSAEDGGDVILAKVGTDVITRLDLTAIFTSRRVFRRNPEIDRARIGQLIEEQIERRLVSLEAVNWNLEGEDKIKSRLARALTLQATALFSKDHVVPYLEIDTASVDSFYLAHKSRYTASRAQRRVRHISVSRPGRGIPEGYSEYVDPVYEGWDDKRKIDSIYTRLVAGEDFARLASVHTEDPHSKQGGGDMGWVSRFSMDSGAFTDFVLSIPLHKISRPFETGYGWHIVQVTYERPAGLVPRSPVIDADIVKMLVDDRSTAINQHVSDSLRDAGRIEIFDEVLAISDRDLDPGTTMAIVNGRDSIQAADYLIDHLMWQGKYHTESLSAQQKREVIMSEYYERMCWVGLLRDRGYFDDPTIVQSRTDAEFTARRDLVRVHVSATDVRPDSAAIARHYRSHPEKYTDKNRTLKQAWGSIRNDLRERMQEREKRRRLAKLEARHGVVRYESRWDEIALPVRP